MKRGLDQVLGEEMGIREASDNFSVPKTTLADKVTLLKRGGAIEIKSHTGQVNSSRHFQKS